MDSNLQQQTSSNTSNESLAAQILDQVKKAGASADLIIDEGESLVLKAQQGELEEYKVSSSRILGLRVIKDNQVGTAYSEATDDQSIRSLVLQALNNASYGKQEPHESIVENNVVIATDDEVHCPLDNTSVDEKIDMALAIEATLTNFKNIKNVPYNGINDGTSQRQIFSSEGLKAKTRSRMCAAFAYALAEEGENNVMQGASRIERVFSSLDIKSLTDEVHANCLALLNGKPIESKHYDVIFDVETLVSLGGVFGMMYSAKSAKDGINPMRDKLATKIADERLSIYDNPLNQDGFGFALFDAEGIETQKIDLISKGIFNTLIHNTATASFFGQQTTGHASRGPRSTLGVGLHQTEIESGSESMSSLQGGETLEIVDLTGLHSGANAISGDFSFGASGYLCRDGERIQPVRGITVAGNFYEMLNRIAAIGDTQFWNQSKTTLLPLIRFSDVAVSG